MTATRFQFAPLLAARRGRGAAYITTLLVVVILAAVVLVFAREMHVGARAASHEASQYEAKWIAQGALEAVRGELAEQNASGAPLGLDLVAAEAGQLGGGLYWILRPPIDGTHEIAYGLDSEAGRLNLNSAPESALALLPPSDDRLAAAIVDWRDEDNEITDGGAENEYYQSRRDGYPAKNGPFETVGELGLVRDVTAAMYLGEDANRNGILDPGEDRDGDNTLDPGLRDLLTVDSSEPAGDADTRVDLNQASPDELRTALQSGLSEERANQLVGQIASQRPYRNLIDFLVRSAITEDEFELVYAGLRAGNAAAGRVDIYAASADVLDTLPGLDIGDGETLVSARPTLIAGDPPPSLAWIVGVLGEEKAVDAADVLTTRSYQFAVDIVAVSGDGRAFYRLRAIIDALPTDAGGLPTIRRVENLTHLGWPLDPAILTDLRAGTSPADVADTYATSSL